MSDSTTRRMTVAEFRQLPETESFYYELRHGELVSVTRPKLKHHWIQHRLRRLLERLAEKRGSWNPKSHSVLSRKTRCALPTWRLFRK